MQELDQSLVWFRRDLRTNDHAALHHALRQSRTVFCCFIFDKKILQNLPPTDRRVAFIHASVRELQASLQAMGGSLIVVHAQAIEEIPRLAAQLKVQAVFCNHDYEPEAVARDEEIRAALNQQGQQLYTYKDQVIFEKSELLTLSGTPFSVFTPYKNAWLKRLTADPDAESALQPWPIEPYTKALAPYPAAIDTLPSLTMLGFNEPALPASGLMTGMTGAQALLADFEPRLGRYADTRNFPAIKGPSYLSVHSRFGTVSIRSLARLAFNAVRSNQDGAGVGAGAGAAVWLAELIWRDFYFMILHHHPRVVEHAFKPAYDRIEWESGAAADLLFSAWCEARTGYPLVDAAMLQLNTTGYMHNRLRMVTACFLIKDLGIDWRRGERYFSEKLIDFDLAANNGGWQWAASSGCDAQPYFRIFNPVTQSEKFDPEGKFIKRYLPQLAHLSARDIHAPWTCAPINLQLAGLTLGVDYPEPIVVHEQARKKTLERYAVVKNS